MMSSVIPARLEFQCGHAALVSLPKVKHESSTQRTERVAREKTDALGRRCDFCGPLVAEVVAVAEPQLVVRSNGIHATTNVTLGSAPPMPARVSAAEASVSETTPPALSAGASPVIAQAGADAAWVTAAATPEEAARPVAAAELAVVAPPAARTVVTKRAVPLPLVAAPAVPTTPLASPVVAAPSVGDAPRPKRVTRKPVVAKPVVKAKPVLGPVVAPKVVLAASRRYAVRFRAEQLIRAADLRDALRQAEGLGAIEVLAIAAV